MTLAQAVLVNRDIRTIESQLPSLSDDEAIRAGEALRTVRDLLTAGEDAAAEVLARTTLAWTSDAARFGRPPR